ncbi:veil, partial [Drosophila busckii]
AYQLIILACALLLGQTLANPIDAPHAADAVATELIVLHNNDMHARFEQTNARSGQCTADDAKADKCYGGFARVAHEVRKYREEAKKGGTPVFYLNAGDTYTGTAWFAVFKDKIASAFLNKLQPDAISLGNHEFDKNVEGLIPFLNDVQFPVLACNLDLSKEPELAATKLTNSTVLETNGVKIGVIGYLTPETKNLTSVNDVMYNEEIVSINEEAARLKAQGIKIIIALGHSGYQKDQQIALHCPEVDIVIGGHSHTYLDSNKPIADKDDTNAEANRGPFPTVVEQPSGKKVPVVQAYAYTKYLGKLHLQFDAEGNLLHFDGEPILLNATIPQDPEILQLLEYYRPNITSLEQQIVGYTKTFLEGGTCRLQECNLGNLIADSMVHTRVLEDESGKFWTDAPIALLQGGGIRSSIEKNVNGSITGSDVLTVLPFENALYITRISGKTLMAALERSAAIRNADSNGGFLQFSGINVVYDYDMEEGHHVVSAMVRCAECAVPIYSPLNETSYYKVVVSEFLLNGGDGYVMKEKDEPFTLLLKKNDQFAFAQYLEARHYVYPALEGRIVIRGPTENKDDGAASIIASVSLIMFSTLATRFF